MLPQVCAEVDGKITLLAPYHGNIYISAHANYLRSSLDEREQDYIFKYSGSEVTRFANCEKGDYAICSTVLGNTLYIGTMNGNIFRVIEDDRYEKIYTHKMGHAITSMITMAHHMIIITSFGELGKLSAEGNYVIIQQQTDSLYGSILIKWDEKHYLAIFRHTIEKFDIDNKGVLVSALSGTDFFNIKAVAKFNDVLYIGTDSRTGYMRKFNPDSHLFESISGHTGSVNSFYVTTDHLYSGSSDQTIRKWDKNNECVEVFRDPNHNPETIGSAHCLTFMDGYLYSGHSNGCIKKWA